MNDKDVFIRHTKDGYHLARNDAKKSSIQGTHVTYQDGISHCMGTSHIPMTEEPICVASRGRYINGKDGETEQRFEVKTTGISNALTTVQKDCYVGEPIEKKGDIMKDTIDEQECEETSILQNPHGFNKGGEYKECTTLTSHSWEQNNFLKSGYRIRKLTPVECWKLMGLTKADCEKARNIGVADGNLYKQAGNGLVTNCIQLLFEHLYKALYDDTYTCTDENFIRPQTE